MARLCGTGLIGDIGYPSHPNLFLKGKIIGIDIRHCKAPPNYWKVILASGDSLPFTNSFDAIFAGEVIEHLENPIKFLIECNRALKEGGKLVLSTPNPYHPGIIIRNILGNTKNLFSDTHLYLLPYRILIKLLELSGFKVHRCYGNYCKIPGIPIRIPTRSIPTISSNIIYSSEKMKSVRYDEIFPALVMKLKKFTEDHDV